MKFSLAFYFLKHFQFGAELLSQSCQTLSDFMDCSPQGSSVHGIL